MSEQRFTDVIGTGGKSIKWERPFFFFAALFVADLVWMELGPSIEWSATNGFHLSFFDVSPPWAWVITIALDVLLTVLVVLAFRWSPNAFVALAIVIVLYPPLSFAIRTVIFLIGFGGAWKPQLLEIVRSLISSFAYVFCFVGGLTFALWLIRNKLLALLLGAVGGTIVSDLIFLIMQLIIPQHFDSRPVEEPGRLMREIINHFALTPFAILGAILFAIVFWLALRLTRDPSGPRLSKPFYAGVFAVTAGISGFLSANTTLLLLLKTWKQPTTITMASLRAEMLGVYAILAMAWGLALITAVVMAVLIYKMWAAIQDGHARTTPGRAVGFLFIPFFNLYWAFQALWGFAKDYNSYIQRHGLDLRRLPEGLFLAYIILSFAAVIPFLGWLLLAVNIVVGTIMIARICDAVNALPGGDHTPAVSQAIAA